jgi:hypothetical protein
MREERRSDGEKVESRDNGRCEKQGRAQGRTTRARAGELNKRYDVVVLMDS